eukprot:gene6528-13214_t
MSPRQNILSLLVSIFYCANCSSSVDTCVYLDNTPTAAPTQACAGAVDYAFFLPSDHTKNDFNKIAMGMLNNTGLVTLPNECQKSIKKMVCSNIYLKCQPGIKLNSTTKAGWNVKIYTDLSLVVPMPFQRPCKSVCTNTISKCIGMLGMMGMTPNCSATMDYSHGMLPSSSRYPYQYDSSNNSTVCNAMTSDFRVQSTREPCIYANNPAGACYGIIKDVYVPPGPLLSPYLAPMQQPFVVQSMIEGMLKQSFSALPVFMSKDCRFALKKYFCGSYMMAPSNQVFSQVLIDSGYSAYLPYFPPEVLGNTFSLPSFPHQSVCTNYQEKCGMFIMIAGQAALVPHCEAVGAGGVSQYPVSNQTLQTVPINLGITTINVKYITPANMMQGSIDDDYETQCPEGFVVPDDPDPIRTGWIPGSGCAFACHYPSFTLDEWKVFDTEIKVISWIAFPCALFFLITWLTDKDRRKQYLVVCFAAYSGLNAFMLAVLSCMDMDKAFCKSNSVGYDKSDGITFGNAAAVIAVLSSIGTTTSWCALSIDLFLKVGMGYRSTSNLKPVFLAFLILLPLGCFIAALLNDFGFANVFPLPFISAVNDTDTYYFFIPNAILTIIGMLAMVAVIFKIVDSIRRNSSGGKLNLKSFLAKFGMLRTPLIFCICFLILMITYLSNRIDQYKNTPTFIESLISLVTCIFTVYDGTDKWKETCGAVPKQRLQVDQVAWLVACITGQSILISMIYLTSPSVWKMWSQRTGISVKRIAAISGFGTSVKRKNRPSVYNENGSVAVGGGGSTSQYNFNPNDNEDEDQDTHTNTNTNTNNQTRSSVTPSNKVKPIVVSEKGDKRTESIKNNKSKGGIEESEI